MGGKGDLGRGIVVQFEMPDLVRDDEAFLRFFKTTRDFERAIGAVQCTKHLGPKSNTPVEFADGEIIQGECGVNERLRAAIALGFCEGQGMAGACLAPNVNPSVAHTSSSSQ